MARFVMRESSGLIQRFANGPSELPSEIFELFRPVMESSAIESWMICLTFEKSSMTFETS